jgi:GMP synthase (glutamine-hydrolysing)
VSKSILIERLTVFKDKYTDGDDHLQQVLDSAEETPESNGLLKKFVDRVLIGGEGCEVSVTCRDTFSDTHRR